MHFNFLPFLLLVLPVFAAAQTHADCDRALEICKKQSYNIENARGEGQNNREADFVTCFMNGANKGQAEQNSTWIKFEIAKAGSLSFVITPHQFDNDIDFVVFKLPTDGNCQNKQIIRCMAAGDPETEALTSKCLGETGLRTGERVSSRDAGCGDEGDNTWLAPLKVVEGEKYAILISNVTMAGPGFKINFAGSCKLPCDEEPKKEKPKKDPPAKKPEPKPGPPIVNAPLEAPKPDKIGGRDVEIGETLKVSGRKITVKIWDSQVEDGDVCSIYLDDKKVVDHLYLTLQPKEFEIELTPGKREHYLTVYADDFGKAEPNTAKVQIFDGKKEYVLDLVAGRSKQESLKIITD